MALSLSPAAYHHHRNGGGRRRLAWNPVGAAFPSRKTRVFRVICSAADVPAGYTSAGDENPYEVLGVNPLENFEKVKTVYKRKQKEAEGSGDEASVARLERAYDKIMMSQLYKRKQGLTFGSVEVSKNIKYADKQPLVPWGPKKAKSGKRDMIINGAISVAMSLWVLVAQGAADWKPLQILIFVHVFQLFQKIKSYEPPESPEVYSEEELNQRMSKSGKRLLRTFALVFGCVTIASLAFTGILNVIEFSGSAIPLWFYNSQETFVTLASAVLLFLTGSYYR